MKKTRVLLADDHPLTLEGLRAFLDPHLQVEGTFTDGRTLVEATLRLKPDLVILDIAMPLLNGIDAAVQIQKALPRTKLLFVTMHVSPAYLEAALNAGGNGYVLKSAAREELLDAIRNVLDGQLYVSPSLSSGRLDRFSDPSRAAASLRLTLRERETLQLIAEGKSAKEIAFILNISVKTVSFHRENIRKKAQLEYDRAIDQARARTRPGFLAGCCLPSSDSDGTVKIIVETAHCTTVRVICARRTWHKGQGRARRDRTSSSSSS